ncbi:hypothetical protein C8J55DRAFT_554614 [Lentinula edodes]|uniref:Uncharacterized protein n=1 Tax=Lentinula lateritia TaxID=40482 RepID=A0A9W9B1Z1_9AGAR|nr:hypothetical protein C8J55DRAFT_554614 [Lentinula edodes]
MSGEYWYWSGCSQGMTLPPLVTPSRPRDGCLLLPPFHQLSSTSLTPLTAVSSNSDLSPSHTPSPLLPPLTALGEVPSPDSESDGEVEQDQLAFTLESPFRPQLQLFETVFNTGKPLSGYCQDDPLWLLLVEYFARRCNQDLAYSRRFLELHGTSAHQSTWGIPLSAWCEYDAALHARTSSTLTLLELNMLDKKDAVEADQQELQEFLALQQGEAVVAAKRKRDRSPLPVAGSSRKKVRSDAPKKRSCHRTPVAATIPGSPLRIRLVVPPSRPVVASSPPPVRPHSSPSLMEILHRDLPMQGPSDLVRLAAAAEVHPGLVQQAGSSSPARTPIKGAGQDLLSLTMPPILRPALVPRNPASHPYRAENQHLLARHEVEYRSVLDQFHTLDRALSVFPGQTVVQHLQALEEELRVVKRDRDVAVEELSTASCKASELKTALLQQQGLVDETNALATHQRRRLEEVHRTRDRAAFVEQMIKEYSCLSSLRSNTHFYFTSKQSDSPTPNALLWDLNLGNVEATPYIELRAASPLLLPTLEDVPPKPQFPGPPPQAYIFSGAYTLQTHSLYDLFDLTLTF